jgi:D-xylose transport system substrate-binding protein
MKETNLKKVLNRSMIVVALVALGVTALVATAATASTAKKAAGGEVCALFPDPATSIRWVHYDAPALKAELKKANVSAQIYNAGGDAQKQKAQADQCLASGAKVLIVVALDAGSATAIEKEALAKGVPSIDYDRQTVGGVAKIYVSFDGKREGLLIGQAVVKGLKANGKYSQHPVVAEVNGSKTDANALLFKAGYDSVLNPLYKNGTFKKGPDQFVPLWNNQTAGTIFDQMLVKTGNKIDAVAVANDGMAGAVIASLQKHGLKPIPVAAGDATPEGFQNIISGWQTMTVWKDTRKLAKAAALEAIALINNKALTTVCAGDVDCKNGSVANGSKREPAYIVPPIALYKSNWTQIYTSGFLKKSDVCTGTFAKYCK